MPLFSTPKVYAPKPPDPKLAQEKLRDERRQIDRSRDQFIMRQGTLGSSQLTAPTLKY